MNKLWTYHEQFKNCEQVGQLQNRSRVGFTSEHTDETHEFAQFVEDFDQVNIPSCQEQDWLTDQAVLNSDTNVLHLNVPEPETDTNGFSDDYFIATPDKNASETIIS